MGKICNKLNRGFCCSACHVEIFQADRNMCAGYSLQVEKCAYKVVSAVVSAERNKDAVRKRGTMLENTQLHLQDGRKELI